MKSSEVKVCHGPGRSSAFFTVQLSHPYMTTGKTIALTRQTFVGKVMSLLLNTLYRFVITFLPRSKGLLISEVAQPVSDGVMTRMQVFPRPPTASLSHVLF